MWDGIFETIGLAGVQLCAKPASRSARNGSAVSSRVIEASEDRRVWSTGSSRSNVSTAALFSCMDQSIGMSNRRAAAVVHYSSATRVIRRPCVGKDAQRTNNTCHRSSTAVRYNSTCTICCNQGEPDWYENWERGDTCVSGHARAAAETCRRRARSWRLSLSKKRRKKVVTFQFNSLIN